MPPMPMPGGMPGASPGGAPPAPPGGTGPASVPGRMQGGAAQGANLLRGALEQLQKALALIPLGGDLHQAVIKAVSDLSKHVGEAGGAGDPQAVLQQLAALAREKQTSAVPPAGLAGGGAPLPPGGGAPPPPM